MTARDALLYQNARFYEAFENSSMEAMEDLWSVAPHVSCIHPGWMILEGRPAVMESWQRIFAGDVQMKIALRNVRVVVHGKIGIVVLQEEVSYQTGKLANTGSILATNIFEHDGRAWKMIHHHGSPIVVVEEQEGENFRFN